MDLGKAQVKRENTLRRRIAAIEYFFERLENWQRLDADDIGQQTGIFVDDLCILLGQADKLQKGDDAL